MERRSILHLSDLHFGRHSDAAVDSILHFARSLPSPVELVVVTGDLTQRAKRSEFQQAAAFLKRLQALLQEAGQGLAQGRVPMLVIPGNHDVSLFNPFTRFLRPFRAYDRWIGSGFPDFFESDALIAVGLRTNDVRSVAEGRLTAAQAAHCRAHFQEPSGKLKILALHHPLVESLSSPFAREILGTGPHLVLSGHRHRYGVVRLLVEGRVVLSLSAGTAVSTRTREEENSFNWIEYSLQEAAGRIRSVAFGSGAFRVKADEEFALPWKAGDLRAGARAPVGR